MNVLLYARVSTESQAQLGHSLEAQINTMREYASQMSWVVAGEYIDRGLSGRSNERAAFLAMINFATSPHANISAILVHKLDRFSRSREDAIFYKALLKKKGVSVISITEPLEASPAGLLVEGILETIAEFYSQNLAEEVKKGQLQVAKKGLNQSEAPLGYRSENGVLIVNAYEAEIIRSIFHGCLQNYSYRQIAHSIETKYQKKLHPATIAYILKNQAYLGHRIWNRRRKDGSIRPESEWIIALNSHEPLISQATFTKVEKILQAKKPHPKTHLFSGLCQCNYCKSTLTCYTQGENVKLICRKKGCPGVSILESKLEKFVFESLAMLYHHAYPYESYNLCELENKDLKRLILLTAIQIINLDQKQVEIVYLN